ncbi:MAG TPA: N-6 DNA methylase, partial [Methanofastidiosum sp.]|nr:N-6 DNA methylase [Methanofastidiosum sp.]
IFDPKIGGHEMLGLYGEAIVKLNQNPNIPQLFRDIFKNAYLPYRDPETLKLFLKTINEFTYDHSERLGDAFEYLLSVLGSQGDAGQFRTPRHIIDFMVQIVNPQKHEQILDPACGTAGFLISSYKHILKENTKKIPGDLLTGEERKKLLTNFKGYDISPDMVRLSLVNLYLHGFVQPKILEYDTLTSEERWNEYADVIMANPPFMTPKGGIKPHKKFGVQSNRSEVLFVDYIAEHLTPNGRSAIIIPESVAEQETTSHISLRKYLIENDQVWCIISLPAGVFNPYSGVKTYIIFLDKRIYTKHNKILYIKVNNDGYDLGKQRKPIKENDLPEVFNKIKEYQKSGIFKSSSNIDNFLIQKSDFGSKYILNGEKYLYQKKQEALIDNSNETYFIGDIIEIIKPPLKLQTSEYKSTGKYPIIDQSLNDIAGYSNNANAIITEGLPFVIFGDHTCSVKFISQPFIQGADGIKIITTKPNIRVKYLYYYLLFNPIKTDGYKRHFRKLRGTKITVPPLDVQDNIINEIDLKYDEIEMHKIHIRNIEESIASLFK